MRLLVTGGLGFIGSNFIDFWFRDHPGDTIVNLDKQTYASDPRYVEKVGNKFDYVFINGDIADKSAVQRSTKNVDIIVNFAAESHVDRSIENSDVFIRSNFIGVKNLLDAAVERNIRFHHVSTDEVYGTLRMNPNHKFHEHSRYNPRNPYAATKAAADMMINAYHNTYGLPVTISNCGNNFGPHQHPEKLIPKTIISAFYDKPVPVYGRGFQIRDWIYVEDHCSAISMILERGEAGRSYLISSGYELRNIDLVKKILQLMGKDTGLINYVSDRPGHDLRYSSDSTLIRKTFGWKPRYSFDGGLNLTINHYVANLELYRDKFQKLS